MPPHPPYPDKSFKYEPQKATRPGLTAIICNVTHIIVMPGLLGGVLAIESEIPGQEARFAPPRQNYGAGI